MKTSDLSRRGFLLGTMTAAPALALGAASLAPARFALAQQPDSQPVSMETYHPEFFTADEWRFIVAATQLLIPADDLGGGAIEAHVPIFIDRQMMTEYATGGLWYMEGPFLSDSPPELGYQYNLTPREVYRGGIADANAHAQGAYQKVFADLTPQQQISMMEMMEKGEVNFPTVPAAVFFSQLLSNTKEGFFADPQYGGNKDMMGWKMIGFPGARADFMDWIGQHNVRYPLPPVSIAGQRG